MEVYIYQSGEHVGQSVLSIILSAEYPQAKRRLQLLDSFPVKREKNNEHKSLEILMAWSAKAKPTAICPICGKRTVSLVAIHDRQYYFELEDPILLCCSDPACKKQAIYSESYGRGSTITRTCSFKLFDAQTRGYKKPIDPKLAWRIIRQAYQIPDDFPEEFLKTVIEKNKSS